MTDPEFEKIVTTAFVNFRNERTNTNYQFDCRPDEVKWSGSVYRPPLPDFKFIDKSSGCTLLIELGRIIGIEQKTEQKTALL